MPILSIKEILESDSIVSGYKGSEKTREMVEKQIKQIYGLKEVKHYNPYKTFTFTRWQNLGYRPIKGSKALQTVAYLEKKNKKGEVINTYPKKINLFYYKAVEPITS